MEASRLRLVLSGLIAIVLLLLISTASAQNTAAHSGYGVRAQTGDAGFNVGWSDLKFDGSGPNRTATLLGGSAGYNATDHVGVLGEYQYARQGSVNGAPLNGQLYGALLRYSLGTNRVSPYLLGGGGGVRESAGAYGVNMSADGWYAAFGGGISLFMGRYWGVRPEFRYNRTSMIAAGLSAGGNLYQLTGGVFFQFGKGSPKSSESRRQRRGRNSVDAAGDTPQS